MSGYILGLVATLIVMRKTSYAARNAVLATSSSARYMGHRVDRKRTECDLELLRSPSGP
jgi:hypothetical protein